MKSMLVGAAAFALLASASFSSAFSEASKPAGGNTSGDIVQRSDSGSANPAAAVPHYELQYHYRGRHVRWVGEWVLVR